jgi:hypothetical protein
MVRVRAGLPSDGLSPRCRILAIALLAGLMLLASMGSLAFAKCNPNRTNDGVVYYTGWGTTSAPSLMQDVNSTILNYSPYVANVANNDVTAWSMLLDPNTERFAQVGWMELPNNQRFTFTEWEQSPTNYNTSLYLAKPVGNNTNYEVYYFPAAPYPIFYYVNGTEIDMSAMQFNPTYGYILGELLTFADQAPGAIFAHETFKESYWNGGQSGLPRHEFNGTPVSVNAAYGQTVISTTRIDTWDTACTT